MCPKRHDDLFGAIASFPALRAAAKRAIRGKRGKSMPAALAVAADAAADGVAAPCTRVLAEVSDGGAHTMAQNEFPLAVALARAYSLSSVPDSESIGAGRLVGYLVPAPGRGLTARQPMHVDPHRRHGRSSSPAGRGASC